MILVYFDDPNGEQGANQTRYLVGVPLGDEPNSQLALTLRGMGFEVCDCGEAVAPSIHAQFPFTGPLSVFLSLWRVYPRGFEELTKRGLKPGPVVEHTHQRKHVSDFFFFSKETLPSVLWKVVEGV